MFLIVNERGREKGSIKTGKEGGNKRQKEVKDCYLFLGNTLEKVLPDPVPVETFSCVFNVSFTLLFFLYNF